jgi:hypothetical protein
MDQRWYPAVIVVALVAAMFYALHADLSPPAAPSGHGERPQQAQQERPAAGNQGGESKTIFSGVTLLDLAELVLAGSTVGLWIVTGRSVRVAERSLVDVERALIIAARFDVHQIVRANRAIGYRVTVIFVNSGRTPALRLRGNFDLVVFPGEPVPDFAYPDRAAPDDAFGTTGPQVPVLFHLEIVTEDLVDVREGRKVALIYGWVEYDDLFSSTRRRRTEACFKIEVIGDIHRIRPADEPIGATPSVLAFANYGGRYNAIDEYCLYEPGQTPVDDGSLPAPRQPPPISEDAV